MAKAWSVPPSLLAGKVAEDVGRMKRAIAIQIWNEIIFRAPVGNPELWAINATAVSYNQEVSSYNASLRDDPDNLTKNGRLKRGRKVNDSMEVRQPALYRPGMFRASNFVSVGGPSDYTPAEPDPTSNRTLNTGMVAINEAKPFETIYIQSNLPYSVALENGHSKQAPAGVYAVSFHGVILKYKG